MSFNLVSPFQPQGDQPEAIKKLLSGVESGYRDQTLLGVTGSGKTFTMANIIAAQNRPTLVLAHNKTLAAQLASEFKAFFPDNAVHYFVSYYDYYQPEAYIPKTDTYIEKETSINDEIDRLRHAATHALLTRRDVIIVASVSCIYGLGEPEEYLNASFKIEKGGKMTREAFLNFLIANLYERNDMELARGRFRVRGDTVEVIPAYEENVIRVEFFGSEIDSIGVVSPITGSVMEKLTDFTIYPAKIFMTTADSIARAEKSIYEELKERIEYFKKHDKLIEAQRIEQKVNYDLEMLKEVGYVNGIENYARHLSGRTPGSPPSTLIDFFPKDFLTFIDESHMTVPQVRGMYNGDAARKQNLVDFGFRLPSARDNRPLTFDEFDARQKQIVYVSATPAPYEIEKSIQVVEQIIRPTGLVDPVIEIKPTTNQIDDLIEQIRERTARGQRILITTLTKKLAERISLYLQELGIKAAYMHSDVDTLDRLDILRDLRLGRYDCLIGINLLREGLDLPEVSLVAILDADKEGFLRSYSAFVQIMGRAARNVDGKVIMYADSITGSMQMAIDETNRRRTIQEAYNTKHGITPHTIDKAVSEDGDWRSAKGEEKKRIDGLPVDIEALPEKQFRQMVRDMEKKMDLAARNLEFEKAADIRDHIFELETVRRREGKTKKK
ncbi:MAG: excinuclease ABC subunit UvrB [Patescibacteria group bacterium]